MTLEFVVSGADPAIATLFGREYALSTALFLAAVAVAGAPILRNGYYSARTRSPNIDFLMGVGIVASVATVGVAMGAAGTDTALEIADVALMGDGLSRLPYLYDLSRTANGVIRQNVWASLAVKAVLAAGAPFGIVTVIHAVVIGDMGMSLGVTGNALRLSRVAPEEPVLEDGK